MSPRTSSSSHPPFHSEAEFASRIAGVILAAGKSQRFGAPKVLQRFRGIPFLTRIVHSLRAAGINRILLTLGYQAESLLLRLPDTGKIEIIRNLKYEMGQFSSIQAAVRHISTDYFGILLCLIDQPHIQETTYQLLVSRAASMPDHIVIPTYKNRGGHPVYVPAGVFPSILSAPGQENLRHIFSQYPDHVLRVAIDDPGLVQDINTPDDLHQLEKEDPKLC